MLGRRLSLSVKLVAFFSILLLGWMATAWMGVHHRLLCATCLHASLKTKLKNAVRPPADKPMMLVLALDGVPYRTVQELKAEGRFRGYGAPGKLISPFPSLTKLSFAEMLDKKPPSGYERIYYDAQKGLVESFSLLKKLFIVENHESEIAFLGSPGYISYAMPGKFKKDILEGLGKRILSYPGTEFFGYISVSDSIAHVLGEEALKSFLRDLDSKLEEIRAQSPRPIEVVLFSDHGNNLVRNKRVDIGGILTHAGFRRTNFLKSQRDFVLPENGLVGVAIIHTAPENTPELCGALTRAEGVDLCIHRHGKMIHVIGGTGEAVIHREGDRLRYAAIDGDPLRLALVMGRLKQEGRLGKDGYASDRDWWRLTKDHTYPDALNRVWHGMTALVKNPASIIISLKDGFVFGPLVFYVPKTFAKQTGGTHGGLHSSHSIGFFMSGFADAPSYLRASEVPAMLARAHASQALFRSGITPPVKVVGHSAQKLSVLPRSWWNQGRK